MPGKLVLCATPIGNLEDIGARALRTLSEADAIACEDVRRTRKLLAHFGIAARSMIVLNEGNERRRTGEIVARIRAGDLVVLVSDAGVPGLSDPGYHLVRACAGDGIPVEIVPGPNAAVSALVLSGLPPGRFAFEGFLPRKQGDRRRRIASLAGEDRTLVFHVSPHRVEETLADMLDGLGDRPAALARELTKLHEEVRRGGLADLLEGARRDPPRGELVLVVGGAVGDHGPAPLPADLARRAHELMAEGLERREALSKVARDHGVSKRDVFDALVEEKASG
jgi:16S rRNA (cytidine1402-2'-O)-methyltransferase